MKKKDEIRWNNPLHIFWVLPVAILLGVVATIMAAVVFALSGPMYFYLAFMAKDMRLASQFINRTVLVHLIDVDNQGQIVGLKDILSEEDKFQRKKPSTSKSPSGKRDHQKKPL